MTIDTYDELKSYIGKPLPNRIWIDIISESFKVSRSVAKEMLHAMYVTKEIKQVKE